MGTSVLKATHITDLDATPRKVATAGEGAEGRVNINEGYVTAVAADAAGSTYQLVRVRSNVKVKQVYFNSEAQGAGKVQIGVYYATDGSSVNAVATLGAAISAALFSGDIDCTSAVNRKDISPGGTAGSVTLDQLDQPLWKMAGLASDPGGNFDIVATVHTTAITTGTGKLGVQVAYVGG